MSTNTARKFEIQSDEEERQQLESALNNWRECVLRFLRDQMSAANEERQDAEDGLAIAHCNQGQVADDVIGTLWDKLEHNSDLLFRLARISNRIQEMDFPDLLTLFEVPQSKELILGRARHGSFRLGCSKPGEAGRADAVRPQGEQQR